MAQKLGNSLKRDSFFGVIIAWMLVAWMCSCSPPPATTSSAGADDSSQFDQTNPLGANAACYVCHMTFVGEELSKTHLRAKVTCIHCHGLSAGHANDEDIGATPPDVTFNRDEVDAMCLKCHDRHEVLAEETTVQKQQPVCTDCHGKHGISRSIPERPGVVKAERTEEAFGKSWSTRTIRLEGETVFLKQQQGLQKAS